jgi:hypothetical protein
MCAGPHPFPIYSDERSPPPGGGRLGTRRKWPGRAGTRARRKLLPQHGRRGQRPRNAFSTLDSCLGRHNLCVYTKNFKSDVVGEIISLAVGRCVVLLSFRVADSSALSVPGTSMICKCTQTLFQLARVVNLASWLVATAFHFHPRLT